ncbi:hypothetical protein YC2023_052457 [Brassica napus]
MKRRVEKTERNKRKRRRRQSSASVKPTPSLPLDHISQIFLKLHAKAVARFRCCVSRLWFTITTDPYFINKLENQPRLLLYFKGGASNLGYQWVHNAIKPFNLANFLAFLHTRTLILKNLWGHVPP